MSRKRKALIIAVGLLTFVVVSVVDEAIGYAVPATVGIPTSIREGDSGTAVRAVQERLASFGYTVAVDGQFGPQTAQAVRHFQGANGLTPDAIVGPLTSGALSHEQATRGAQTQINPPPVVVSPYAPEGWTGCLEMEFYRRSAGLPDQFDAIGYRESRCRNDVVSSIGCCVGYWQIHTGNFTAPGYRDGIRNCGVSARSDILGNSPEQKRRNACVAKVLYDVSGMNPWSL